ncbi:MAG: hypothetical protein ABMA02_11265 [Saprospiraceae bacterium]
MKQSFQVSFQFIFLFVFASFLATSCKDHPLAGTHVGEEAAFGMGKARTYITNDDNGDPIEVGVVIDEDAFKGFAVASTDSYLSLDYPAAAERTPFKHQFMGYAPHGHEPVMVYDKPHFDLHFYTSTEAERVAIGLFDTVKAKVLPTADYFPAAYFQTGLVPAMGVHWLDGTSPELTGTLFTETFIWGSFDGKVTFLEPMITYQFIKDNPTFEKDLKQPAKYDQPGKFYPTKQGFTHDAQNKEYRFFLTSFVRR